MNKKAPDIYVISPDRRLCYGAVRTATEMTEDIRFNTCSEIQFKVADKVCDPETGEWVENPVFDHLEKNNLLYVCDDTEYFSFPNRTLRTDYGIKDEAEFLTNSGRQSTLLDYNGVKDDGTNDGTLIGFKLRSEHRDELTYGNGYDWRCLSTIDESNGVLYYPDSLENYYYKVSCYDFIPINVYDVLAIRCSTEANAAGKNIKFKQFNIFVYTSDDPNTCIGSLTVDRAQGTRLRANPSIRFSINSLSSGDIDYNTHNGDVFPDGSNMTAAQKFAAFKNALSDGGFIRIYVNDNYDTSIGNTVSNNTEINTKKSYTSYYYIYNGVKYYGFSFPDAMYLSLFSGQRYCEQIDNDETTGSYSLPQHWFVIVDTEEEYDGNVRLKTVTGYSYEYVISNKTISLSENVLPLYIPPMISETVNSNDWVIDKVSGKDAVVKGAQYLSTGVLNQVLDQLPGWSIGHISSELMTRYRHMDNVDNNNIYSFLMDDVEQLYQCYFVFDCDNKTISAYTQEDIISGASDIVLTWSNALTKLSVTSQETNIVTALSAFAADNTYGIGLVNPTGSSVIYNFDGIIDKIDFVADSTDNDPLNRNKITENGVTRNRTLKEAVTALQEFVEHPTLTIDTITIDGMSQYRNYGRAFIDQNLSLIKMESKLQESVKAYESIIDKIRAAALTNGVTSYYRSEVIMTKDELSGYYTQPESHSFISDGYYNELISASQNYFDIKEEYDYCLRQFNIARKVLRAIAQKTSLDYKKQLDLTSAYSNDNSIVLSLLTPKEILALQPYIYTGVWTNDNSVFSEYYNANEILDTLVEVYDQARSDMDICLSKPEYSFEVDTVNWLEDIGASDVNKDIKVGQTLCINTHGGTYINPILLELHKNYKDASDFKMTFTTNYRRKLLQFRFADLYSTIKRVNVADSTFTFNE